MLSIRLSRVGSRNNPAFRLVVQEKSQSPFSKKLEILGSYLPTRNPKVVQFNADRIKYWISKGAQPSESVHNMLIAQGILEGKKKAVTSITKKRATKIKAKTPKVEAPVVA